MGNPTYGLPAGFEEPQGFDMILGANPACPSCYGTGWAADWSAGEMRRCECAEDQASLPPLPAYAFALAPPDLDPPMGWAGLAIALGALGGSWAFVWMLFRLAGKA